MKSKSKRRLRVLLAIIIGGFIALNALAYRHAYAMLHFTPGNVRTEKPEHLTVGQKIGVLFSGVELPRPHSDLPPSVVGPACRAISITGSNGIRLGAWSSSDPSSNPLIILFHGYAGDKTGMVPEARAFLDMHCSVLLVDFRGSGESSESSTTVGYLEAEDVAVAVRYANESLPHSRLVLYGGSMGAAAVLRGVAKCGVRPDAIIIEGVFDKLLNTVRHRFEAMGLPAFPSAQLLVFWGGVQSGFNGFAHNPVTYAAAVRCPILFLHGAEDPRARLEEARRVCAAVPGPKQFKEFPNLGHEASVVRYPAEWKQAITDFLKEADPKPVH
jgi:hypothetical protein